MVTETKIKFLMQPKNWNQNRKFTNWKANKRNWNQNMKIWYEKQKLIVYWAKLINKIKIVISCQDFEFSNHNQNQNSYLKKIITEINQNSSEFRLAALLFRSCHERFQIGLEIYGFDCFKSTQYPWQQINRIFLFTEKRRQILKKQKLRNLGNFSLKLA